MSAPVPTDWRQYGLAEIWAMLEPESRADGQIAVDVWRRIRAMTEEQSDVLRRALAVLQQRWPTSQPAAAIFQEYGAALVSAMQDTADTARANGPTVDAITADIDAARTKIAELAIHAQELEQVEQQSGTMVASQEYVRRFVSSTDIDTFGWLDWRAGLDREAQQVMTGLERQVANHAPRLMPENPFAIPGSLDPPGGGGPDVRDMLAHAPLAGPPTSGVSEPLPIGLVAPRGGPGLTGSAGAGSGVVPMVPPMMGGQPGTAEGGKVSVKPKRRGLPGLFDQPPPPPTVIRPPEPATHDPGPGVIGIDR